MIGAAIGAGISAVGSIFGGISATKAMKAVEKNLKAQKQANQDWYDRRYNEDATQRADAQRLLTQTQESMRAANRQAAATAAVMGGTDESVAAQKAAGAQAMADAASSIAVAADARKDNIEQQYMQRDAEIQNQLNDLKIGKANAISQAIQGVGQAASSFGGGLDEYLASKKTPAATPAG